MPILIRGPSRSAFLEAGDASEGVIDKSRGVRHRSILRSHALDRQLGFRKKREQQRTRCQAPQGAENRCLAPEKPGSVAGNVPVGD